MKCQSYERFFGVIANSTRLKIIDSLAGRAKSVNEICDSVKEEQSKISHNLNTLMKCHIVEVKRDGKKRIYSLNQETIVPLLSLVEKHVSEHCDGDCWRRK